MVCNSNLVGSPRPRSAAFASKLKLSIPKETAEKDKEKRKLRLVQLRYPVLKRTKDGTKYNTITSKVDGTHGCILQGDWSCGLSKSRIGWNWYHYRLHQASNVNFPKQHQSSWVFPELFTSKGLDLVRSKRKNSVCWLLQPHCHHVGSNGTNCLKNSTRLVSDSNHDVIVNKQYVQSRCS